MDSTIFVAGHKGMVGSALVRQIGLDSSQELLLPSRDDLDLSNQAQVNRFFLNNKIDQVYLAAAKVGGILANSNYPAEFIYQNLMMQSNIIEAAFQSGVRKLLFLGSSCIYPRLAEQPISEQELLSGQLEPTNEPYAIAKIAGIKMCESYNRQYGVDYRSVMPTNLYGQFDNFHPEHSHVIPAMMRRFHDAKLAKKQVVDVWGSGNPMREFLHVDDMAEACVHIMNLSVNEYSSIVDQRSSHINVGTGLDCSIRELANTMAAVVGYEGQIRFDISKPDGAPRKLLNVDRISATGWQARVSLADGLENTYEWFLDNIEDLRGAS